MTKQNWVIYVACHDGWFSICTVLYAFLTETSKANLRLHLWSSAKAARHVRRAGEKRGWDGSKAAKVLWSSVSHCPHHWDTQPQAPICSFLPTEIPVTIATNFCIATFPQECLEKQFIFIHYHHIKLYKYVFEWEKNAFCKYPYFAP